MAGYGKFSGKWKRLKEKGTVKRLLFIFYLANIEFLRIFFVTKVDKTALQVLL
jgi:hypothetical protein